MDARFWHTVTEAFEKNDTAFQRYNEFMTRGAHVRPCDAACKKVAICQMRAARAENNCVRLPESYLSVVKVSLTLRHL